ncbi:MAG: BofC C-terminal domain-containing protein [Defluviitaleaceae bacterium]|nr:BofC C-terminal domain-containing protein [Defluviitaleaceae bacterium]
MKKKYVLITICTISALTGIGLGYFFFGPATISASESTSAVKYEVFPKYIPIDSEPELMQAYSTINPTPEPLPIPSHLFVVSIYDGYIAVYHSAPEGKGILKEVTTTKINALPLIEQVRLEQGINIYTEEALIRILEDYGS